MEITGDKRIKHVLWLVLGVFVLLGYLLQNVAGSAYFSMEIQGYGTVSAPPVILEEGTSGSTTVYVNGTSAKASTGSGDFQALNMTENQGTDQEIRLKAYDQSNLSRLYNCSIYIYDGSNSSQIVILNGNYSQQQGMWHDLAASDTEYIWMHVVTSSPGISYVYVYLEIRVPDTTTIARYIISFEIT
jgi:hypothetical protein